jgi:nucleotidyltransferase substrate binding protein (TIGR01987 family)
MSDLEKNLKNLTRATDELRDFLTIKKPSKVERAGIIMAFEFCYELFWKTFQKQAASDGLVAGSPKQAIKAAFSMALISDDVLWLKMINDRNLTVHTYNVNLSIEIYERVRDLYAKEFDRCLHGLKNLSH